MLTCIQSYCRGLLLCVDEPLHSAIQTDGRDRPNSLPRNCADC